MHSLILAITLNSKVYTSPLPYNEINQTSQETTFRPEGRTRRVKCRRNATIETNKKRSRGKMFKLFELFNLESVIIDEIFGIFWGGGDCDPKKPEKKQILKFAVAFVFFPVFFGFFRFFLWYFFCFFGLYFDKKFQPFKTHVNNEVLRGQESPNNTHNAYSCKCVIKAIITNRNHLKTESVLNRTR